MKSKIIKVILINIIIIVLTSCSVGEKLDNSVESQTERVNTDLKANPIVNTEKNNVQFHHLFIL